MRLLRWILWLSLRLMCLVFVQLWFDFVVVVVQVVAVVVQVVPVVNFALVELVVHFEQ